MQRILTGVCSAHLLADIYHRRLLSVDTRQFLLVADVMGFCYKHSSCLHNSIKCSISLSLNLLSSSVLSKVFTSLLMGVNATL